MSETNLSAILTHHSQLHILDPISLILHQNPFSDVRAPLKLTTETYIMERGPRYRAYAELRESKLRMKKARQLELEEPEKSTPPLKKQVRFHANLGSSRKGCSVLAQSVPDFSATLRKENRKPVTPPAKNWTKNDGVLSESRGSKSASAGEKRGLRKSYANIDELKGLCSAAANAINGENRGGKSGRVLRKSVLGYNRQV